MSSIPIDCAEIAKSKKGVRTIDNKAPGIIPNFIDLWDLILNFPISLYGYWIWWWIIDMTKKRQQKILNKERP